MHIAAAEELPEPGRILDLHAVDGVLVLTLDPKASFEALRASVREALSASPDRFRGHDARLDLASRGIDLFDLRRLVHVLKDEFGVTVTGLYCSDEALLRFAERELKLRLYVRAPEREPAEEDTDEVEVAAAPPPAPEAPVAAAAPEREPGTLTLDRSVRGGQVVRFAGDVHIFGDVNPGAEVLAGGNILVFGALKGLVHAGVNGDEGAVILGFEMRPTQLRIGRRIAFPTGSPDRPGRAAWLPEIAWVDRGEILIEPYQGRLPR